MICSKDLESLYWKLKKSPRKSPKNGSRLQKVFCIASLVSEFPVVIRASGEGVDERLLGKPATVREVAMLLPGRLVRHLHQLHLVLEVHVLLPDVLQESVIGLVVVDEGEGKVARDGHADEHGDLAREPDAEVHCLVGHHITFPSQGCAGGVN